MLKPNDLATIHTLIANALAEDIGSGDITTLACIDSTIQAQAKLIVKEKGILAGVEIAQLVLNQVDSTLKMNILIEDGTPVKFGDIAFTVSGSAQSILTAERLLLNIMQRMSGIATHTNRLAQLISHTSCKLLDTRKTTPGFRILEKLAVKIGGGINHRFGLYDMIMIKDNHVDFAGGIENAVKKAKNYLSKNQIAVPIEVEVRNTDDLKKLIPFEGIQRVMLDNFSPQQIIEAIQLIPSHIETEASGGITETSLVSYAETGVNYISVGALTHQIKSLDLSLKAY